MPGFGSIGSDSVGAIPVIAANGTTANELLITFTVKEPGAEFTLKAPGAEFTIIQDQ
jgi:hypothetical protein